MDVWDALKLMARRWYIAVPMVVLTLMAALWTFITVKPHHVSEGHIMLLPPSQDVITNDDGVSESINPWTTDSLMAAVVTRLSNRALEEELAQAGYRASWEADTDVQFSSVVEIRTQSDSPGDAQETLRRLMNVVEVEVEQQQQPYELPPQARITSLQLDAGENLELARGNQARALIVVVGIGGIMTLITTVSGDVLLRGYARRRSGTAAPWLSGDVPTSPAGPAGNGSAPASASSHPAGPYPVGPPEHPPARPPEQPPARPAAAAADRRTVVEGGPDQEPVRRYSFDDSTIMLPVSREAPQESSVVGDLSDRDRGQ